jgi:hypothetical protein
MTRIARTILALVLTLSPAMAYADPDRDVSLPWQLRPVTIDTVVRLASDAAAFHDSNGNLDLAVITTWTGSYRLSDCWAPTVRLAVVGNDAPGAALDGSSFANPVVGATYGRTMHGYRLAVFGGAAIPVGTGNARTHAASMTARPADRAMFDADYLTGIAGIDVAYVHRGFTAQGEATLAQSVRVRRDEMSGDPRQTHASIGLHVGYVVGGHVAIGGDLHYEDALTASVGVRVQLVVGQIWLRPGIAYHRGFDGDGIDAPWITAQTNAVQIDIPVAF